ncbi:unnamed protein product [Musa acuminata subsp. malaccensis]|uniref:(wild Malaysian banana) hypothetical protein n=1 Tax=Musa acuminata subsp. malaccensis TaxID=214687 RepID=A0A804JJ47_MUSAM|nr:unnamed protein product [Musa acuminata subsp. malaccensis]
MNIFRLAGNMTHLMSVLVLLLKIHTIKSRYVFPSPHKSFMPLFLPLDTWIFLLILSQSIIRR